MGVLDDLRLDGKVALVTGAARGLGQGMAVGLAEAGADVIGLDVAPMDETGEKVSATGRRFHAVSRNLMETKAEGAAEIVAHCVSEMGRLDILVNNAGIIRRDQALEFGEEDWEGVIQYLDDDDNLVLQDDVFSKLDRYLAFCEEENIEPVDLRF